MIQNPPLSQVPGVPLAPLTPDAAITALGYLRAACHCLDLERYVSHASH